MSRIITPAILFSALAACAHNPTPASRTCTVLNTETQLDACVGKSVTVRGRVDGTSIIHVAVDAGPELAGKRASAFGTLEKAGDGYALKNNGTLAKAKLSSSD
jgi:hypothetical protein